MTIDTNLYTIDWIFLGALAALFLGQFYFYVRYMCAPARKMRKDHKSQIKNPDSEIDEVHVMMARRMRPARSWRVTWCATRVCT